MNFDLSEKLDRFTQLFASMSLAQGLAFALLFFVVWFLPTLVATLYNRKNLGKIFLANFPAGLSWVAWVAVLAWAATGKMRGRQSDKDEAAEKPV
jgi:hypothetical protein